VCVCVNAACADEAKSTGFLGTRAIGERWEPNLDPLGEHKTLTC
jgi:succinate dehydrogenase/fumarate reductase-like Fe-S protein